jgi:uncharacterized protein (DUF488 family)
MIYTFGYRGAGTTMNPLIMEVFTSFIKAHHVKLVDIRLSPRSRFFPAWRKGALQRHFQEDYVHVPQLGNLNYQDHSLPIQIANREEGLAVVLHLLDCGWSVCLLCACSHVEHCHRLTVANMLVAVRPSLPVEHLPKNAS